MEIWDKLNLLAKNEGYTQSFIDWINFFKASKTLPRAPLKYESRIIIIWEGKKVWYLWDKTIVYNKDNYLILSIPMAFDCEAVAENWKPLLALIIDIDFEILNEIIAQININSQLWDTQIERGVEAISLKKSLKQSVYRLLEILENREDSKILWKNQLREILYLVLKDSHWNALLSLYEEKSRFWKLAKILNEINKDYSKEFYVRDFAKIMWMSEANFFRYFKKITGFSPIQYIKNIRLQKAYYLIKTEKLLLKEVAKKVWYNSTSQFSREFKRYFNKNTKEI